MKKLCPAIQLKQAFITTEATCDKATANIRARAPIFADQSKVQRLRSELFIATKNVNDCGPDDDGRTSSRHDA